MKISIAGTSFLLPGNSGWRVLQEKHGLSFVDIDAWSSELIEVGPLFSQSDANVFVVFLPDGVGATPEYDSAALDRILSPIATYLQNPLKKPLIVAFSSFAGLSFSPIESVRSAPPLMALGDEFYRKITELRQTHSHLFFLSLDINFGVIGTSRCFDNRNYYAAHCRLGTLGIRQLAQCLIDIFERMATSRKKVLVLDCDNTLWGGVIGEDGLSGIQLGQDGMGRVYKDFQYAIKSLASKGILLAAVSKNDEQAVDSVFNDHPEMVLKKSDFAALKINWSAKSENILQLSEELGLGLDSFVFWDDNPIERDLVKNAIPEISVVNPPELTDWPDTLMGMIEFSQFTSTKEDLLKGDQYRSKTKFNNEIKTQADPLAYLRSINLVPSAVPLTAATISRAAQLCAKTNQFNPRTVRHSPRDIELLAADPSVISFLVKLEDKFGDHGLVGLVIAKVSTEGQQAFLDTFLLSCRVLGRHLEAWMLDFCCQKLREKGVRTLVSEFRPTERNGLVKDFFPLHGFSRSKNGEKSALGAGFFEASIGSLKIPYLEIFYENVG